MASWQKVGSIWGVVLLLAAMQVVSAFAGAPDQPTPPVSGTPVEPPIAEGMPAESVHAVGPETDALKEPLVVTSTVTVGPAAPLTTTLAISATPSLAPTPTPVLTTALRVASTLSGTAHIAVLAGEAVVPISGTASSEVFVSLRDVQQGVQGFELRLSFDPAIAQVVDADDEPGNGVQVAGAAFFAGSQRFEANRVDNATGEIVLALTQQENVSMYNTNTWRRVATIMWLGRKEGKSVVAVERATRFKTADGRLVSPDAVYDGVLFARAPGIIEGIVRLQGRGAHQGALVSGSFAAARVDRGTTDVDGGFRITTSHGEGFYTLIASTPGYLSAESDRPIRVTVDGVFSVGETTLYGGDVNGDNCIDIRDLSYVAWHVDGYVPDADINGDGQVDILDLSLTAGNFGRCGPTIWQIPDDGSG